ncbi:MAG: ABC transporter substrate-binding protein [Bacteriovoracaceae bacterium]|nr:ABC transporter substrate-binding protein [Bacteriovoracaceae bacterium]
MGLERIICLTEESVETLYLIGKSHLIVGVSAYVQRPPEAKLNHPQICHFINGKIDEIIDLKADLIIGYSDVQKNLARDLIDRGQNVWISNHRSLKEILQYIELLSFMVDAKIAGQLLVQQLVSKMEQAAALTSSFSRRPKVYFEEWDNPHISSILWCHEIIELCGGQNISSHLAQNFKSMDRVVTPEFVLSQMPDIMFSCWCGKSMNRESIYSRTKWSELPCLKNQQLFELDPSIFLQPGPAPILAGLDVLVAIFQKWNDQNFHPL